LMGEAEGKPRAHPSERSIRKKKSRKKEKRGVPSEGIRRRTFRSGGGGNRRYIGEDGSKREHPSLNN